MMAMLLLTVLKMTTFALSDAAAAEVVEIATREVLPAAAETFRGCNGARLRATAGDVASLAPSLMLRSLCATAADSLGAAGAHRCCGSLVGRQHWR